MLLGHLFLLSALAHVTSCSNLLCLYLEDLLRQLVSIYLYKFVAIFYSHLKAAIFYFHSKATVNCSVCCFDFLLDYSNTSC